MKTEDYKILIQLLKEIAKEKGITQKVIAEKTGYKQQNISRVFSLKYSPRLDIFLNIAKAVGVNFFFEDTESKTKVLQTLKPKVASLGFTKEELESVVDSIKTFKENM